MKKILALGLGVCLFTSASFGFNTIKTVNSINNFTNKLEKSFNEQVNKISDKNLKKTYQDQFGLIKSDVKEATQYISAYRSQYYVEDAIEALMKFKSLNKEISYVLSSNQNPYVLNTSDVEKVQSGVLTIQKDFVSLIESSLLKTLLSSSGVVTSGNIDLSMNVNNTKINLSMKELQEKTNFKTMSKESTMKLTINVDLTKESSDEFTVYADISAKLIKDIIYITLNDISLSGNSDKQVKSQIELVKSIIKGKTIKIDTKYINSKVNSYSYYPTAYDGMNSFVMMNKLLSILTLLKSESLLTPYKKINDNYYLILNAATIGKIGSVMGLTGEDIKYGIETTNNDIKDSGIYYNESQGTKGLYINIDKYDAIGTVALTDTNSNLTLLADVKGRVKSPDNYFYLLLKKDSAIFQLTVKETYEKTFVDGTWKDNKLVFNVVSLDYDDVETKFSLSGDLSDKLIDLVATYNGKKLGSFKISQENNSVNYDINFSILEQYFNFDFLMKGKVEYEYKDVDISVPTDYIDAEKLLNLSGILPETVQYDEY